MQAGGQGQALERLLALEALPDEPQDGHIHLGPFDSQLAFIGKAQIFDIVRRPAFGRRRHRFGRHDRVSPFMK
jgi:hypothetical protein